MASPMIRWLIEDAVTNRVRGWWRNTCKKSLLVTYVRACRNQTPELHALALRSEMLYSASYMLSRVVVALQWCLNPQRCHHNINL